MDTDFRPPKSSAKSLQAKLDAVQGAPKPTPGSFHTPDEVAASDDLSQPAPVLTPQLDDNTMKLDTNNQKTPKKSRSWRQKLALHWPPGKKEYGVLAAVVVLFGGIIFGVLALNHDNKPTSTAKTAKKIAAPAKPVIIYSTLSGLPVADASINQRPVTGVMIENSVDARPQSGLGEASVVFEAIAEGGITRFLALFQDTNPSDIGPIRSARPYYIQWALGFDAGYAHVGGSPEALADIKAWGVRDLDQFYNGGSYHRVSSRAAPHNVYTGVDTLSQLQTSKGWAPSKFTGFERKVAAPSKQPTAKTVDLTLSGPVYNVHYDYNAATNSYNRSEGGAPHMDANGNKQISPKVVIGLVIPYGYKSDGYHSDYNTIGSGQAYVFQDGNVTIGNWAKSDNTKQFIFTDSTGKPLKLNPGQTWLTAISDSSKVTYAP